MDCDGDILISLDILQTYILSHGHVAMLNTSHYIVSVFFAQTIYPHTIPALKDYTLQLQINCLVIQNALRKLRNSA